MKSVGRLQQLARALERQDAPVVGERVEDDGHVLARLHHLVEIADAALAHGAGQRPVRPDRLAALEKIAAGEVGRGEIVVAGDGVQRQAEPGAMCATNRVLPQPVGPLSSSGSRWRQASSNSSHSLPLGQVEGVGGRSRPEPGTASRHGGRPSLDSGRLHRRRHAR